MSVNILHVINDSCVQRGGAQKVLSMLNTVESESLSYNTRIFSRDWIYWQDDQRQVKGGWFWLGKLIYLLLCFRPDIIVIHSRLYLPLVMLFKLCGGQLIYYCHARYRRFPFLFNVFRCDRYIAVSRSVEEYLSKYIPPSLISVNYNPVGRVYSVCDGFLDGIVFNYVGALQPWKGVDIFLNFLNRYCSNCEVNVTVNIVGDGPEYEKIKSLPLSRYITLVMHGYQIDPYSKLDLRGVQVVPSLEEGFGMVAVEAQQNGSLLLHTDIPALNEVAFNDPYSFSYSSSNFETFAYAIGRLLKVVRGGAKSDILEMRSSKARKRFGRVPFVCRYVEILSEVIEQK